MATQAAGDKPASPKKPAPAKVAGVSAPDWEKIEVDYRAGIKTLRQIADENGVSHPAITKRAKRDDWSRDLSAKIQAKADALVTKELVTREVTKESLVTERNIVDANARAIADVRLAHRKDIARAKGIANSLLDELEDSAQVYELDARVKMSKTLAENLRIAIDMERQAFGMDAKGADSAPGAPGYVPPAVQIIHVAAPKREDDDE